MGTVAINGMGRIGRATFKIALEKTGTEVLAVNELVPVDNLAYLLRHDTVYGTYHHEVQADHDTLIVDGTRYQVFSEKDPAQLPWRELDIDVVFECTGVFTRKENLEKHIFAGAQHVILSAPSKENDVITVVHGVNELEDPVEIISCASCTTNCITPLVEIMGRRIGIKKAIMTTVHAYTASQAIVDRSSKKWTRGRAGAANFVPTSTGAAKATTRVLPQYDGKFDGVAVRGPVLAGSLADIIFVTERETTVDEVNGVFREESEGGQYAGIVGVTEDPIVSSDIIGDSRASVVDVAMTQVVDGDLVKVMAWYDNEWGYANQMVREGVRLCG